MIQSSAGSRESGSSTPLRSAPSSSVVLPRKKTALLTPHQLTEGAQAAPPLHPSSSRPCHSRTHSGACAAKQPHKYGAVRVPNRPIPRGGPPVLFAVLIAGLLVELRARVASPPAPALPPGVAVSMRGNTAMQCALVWAESHWPGPWALPVLCAGTLGALRVVIWAGAALLGQFGERVVDASDAARVKVGRWEDGGACRAANCWRECSRDGSPSRTDRTAN
ncbi:hypothetical protein BC826DRAFT_145342 [Russula brevipes]|nr:hypothetical protein BC826DRAFT_145342 [Russula brevipes]